MSDKELLKGLKQGDRKTVVKIYESLLPRVTNWVQANSGTQSDARDVFQEALETILLRVEKINSSFEGLVMTICRNKWIDRLRLEKRNRELQHKVKPEQVETGLTESDTIAFNKYVLMEKYFTQLSEICQKVIMLIKQDTPVSEIVAQLSFSSANTLYRRKAACVERWAKLIKQDASYENLMR